MTGRLGVWLDARYPLEERVDGSRAWGIVTSDDVVGRGGVGLCVGRWIVTLRAPR